jgi:hypothetical protein
MQYNKQITPNSVSRTFKVVKFDHFNFAMQIKLQS